MLNLLKQKQHYHKNKIIYRRLKAHRNMSFFFKMNLKSVLSELKGVYVEWYSH